MPARKRSLFALAFLLVILVPIPSWSQAEEPAGDVEIYEEFRAWITQQTAEGKARPSLEQYREILAEAGLEEAEIDRRLEVIEKKGQELEVERWNRILTSETPRFNTAPNAYLEELVEQWKADGEEPGRALDVGMGQGRNAIYLASRGWKVTGFDPADEAVAAAEKEAARLGLELETRIERSDEFDFGTEKWDLVVLSYVGVRDLLPELEQSLAPGGRVVIEAFHHDATKGRSIGGAVVFQTNELLELFADYRILDYQDTLAEADFGRRTTRLVRLCAQKQ